MLNFAKFKILPVLLLAYFAGVGFDDSANDLFDDKSYADKISFPAQMNSQCPAWERRQTVVVDESMTLPENCVFEQITIKLTGPNIDFDCNNAVFNGMTKVNRNEYRDAYDAEEAPYGIAFFLLMPKILQYVPVVLK